MQNRELLQPAVDLVLGVRAQYLQEYPRSSLKHWDQIQERLRAAARTSGGVSEMTTRLLSLLSLAAPSSATSSAIVALEEVAFNLPGHRVMAWIESNFALVMAYARKEAERRRETWEATEKLRKHARPTEAEPEIVAIANLFQEDDRDA